MGKSKKTKISKQQPSILKYTNEDLSTELSNMNNSNTKQIEMKKLVDKIAKTRQQIIKKKAQEISLMNKLQKIIKLDEITNRVMENVEKEDFCEKDGRYVMGKQWMSKWQLPEQKILWGCVDEEMSRIDSKDWFKSVLEYDDEYEDGIKIENQKQKQVNLNRDGFEEETVCIWKEQYLKEYERNFPSVLQKLSAEVLPHS